MSTVRRRRNDPWIGRDARDRRSHGRSVAYELEAKGDEDRRAARRNKCADTIVEGRALKADYLAKRPSQLIMG